jgi:hypothetical protein
MLYEFTLGLQLNGGAKASSRYFDSAAFQARMCGCRWILIVPMGTEL